MAFTDDVYEIVKQIPPGKVATYGDVAEMAGSPKAVRAVGNAMKRNVDPSIIPCHRVVGSDGSMHGYAFGEGVSTKRELLTKEGVVFAGENVDLAASRWRA
jgi:methylated-DNA-protein-cysteine methyltransferase related protein